MPILGEKCRATPIKEDVEILNIDGKSVEIDSECVNMVKFFNEIDLKTSMCCQGHRNVDGGRNSFFITFDKTVSDEQMLAFLKKVGKWKQIFPARDRDNGGLKVSRIKRGLNGWVYKRHYFINDKLIKVWTYESSSTSVSNAIYEARRDFMIMDLVYNSKPGELEGLYRKYERRADKYIQNFERMRSNE